MPLRQAPVKVVWSSYPSFELVVFRQVWGLGHEAWLAGRAWPRWLRTLAMQLPGPPANMLFALRKPLEPG